MKLLGYSRYQSKDGTKKGTWLHIGYELVGFNCKGFEGVKTWAPYDIEIDDNLLGKDIEISYKVPKDITKKPIPQRVFKA